jgi:hypothetical protein
MLQTQRLAGSCTKSAEQTIKCNRVNYRFASQRANLSGDGVSRMVNVPRRDKVVHGAERWLNEHG